MSNEQTDSEISVVEQIKLRRPPSLWKVILHNDNYTPMEFVIHILMSHFNKNLVDATEITMDVHEKGRGIAGFYPQEVARQKVDDVIIEARANNFPLMVSAEES
jgi:ATP-dependent Clp protease adaptor protein ClpS